MPEEARAAAIREINAAVAEVEILTMSKEFGQSYRLRILCNTKPSGSYVVAGQVFKQKLFS